jgi:hypothetical protein
LHAGEHHHAAPGQRYFPGDAFGSQTGVGFVYGLELQIDIGAQPPRLLDVLGQAVKTGEGVRRNRRAQPLNDVALVVVVRGLDQHEEETTRRDG